MNIQWQARIFHSFGNTLGRNIIFYKVPYFGEYDDDKANSLAVSNIENGKVICATNLGNGLMLVEFDCTQA